MVGAPSRSIMAASGICRHCRQRLLQTRALSTSPQRLGDRIIVGNAAGQTADDNAQAKPRWARTPQAMKAPFRIRPNTKNDVFEVNEDPRKLDQVYVKIFGQDGEKWLPEEIKWLAVTHKSFDHGRRGFNDRLAFLGRRIIELQASLALLDAPRSTETVTASGAADKYGRTAFQHPALANVENITAVMKDKSLAKTRLAQLAQRYGLAEVVRWKPRQVRNLHSSGIEAVLTHTMFAVVGAVAMQRGGEVANQLVRERILVPLGLM